MIMIVVKRRAPAQVPLPEHEKGQVTMSISDSAKRNRLSQTKIALDVYFLPDRLPQALRHPLEAAGGPDALIKINKAEGYLSPGRDQATGWQCSLTICPPGEGHFMGIDLSISEARKLREVLDYVINWEEDFKSRVRTTVRQPKKGTIKTARTKGGKAKPANPKKAKTSTVAAKKAKATKARAGKGKSRSSGRS
jgi:hypothetical protein